MPPFRPAGRAALLLCTVMYTARTGLCQAGSVGAGAARIAACTAVCAAARAVCSCPGCIGRPVTAGIAAGIGHKIREHNAPGIEIGTAGITAIAGHKISSIQYCGGHRLHNIVCFCASDGHSQPSSAMTCSMGIRRTPVMASKGRMSTSGFSITAPLTGGTGGSFSS